MWSRKRFREYLVRTVAGQECPGPWDERAREVLTPHGYDCVVLQDPSVLLLLRCGSAVIRFSPEEVGWQISVEGRLRDPETFLRRIAEQVGAATGEPCDWVALPPGKVVRFS